MIYVAIPFSIAQYWHPHYFDRKLCHKGSNPGVNVVFLKTTGSVSMPQ